MKQTAMQQHIEWLKDTLEIAEKNKLIIANILKLCIEDAEQKLSMEKDQIERAFIASKMTLKDEEQYYNETFK